MLHSPTEVAADPRRRIGPLRSVSRVNTNDHQSLFASLGHALEILDRNRTPEPEFIAAYDTLKQSRALLQRVLNGSARRFAGQEPYLAAA